MRGLMLNDLYNIGHNAKQMLLIVVIWAFCFASGSDSGTYMIMYSVIFCMMTATICSFDEKSGWAKYAMVLPVSKRDYVLAKYMINLIFALVGCLTGIVVTLVANWIQGKKMEVSLWGISILGICIGVFLGSVLIPLLLQFGTEKARIIMVGMIAIPILIGLVLEDIMEKMNITISAEVVEKIIYAIPVAILPFVVLAFFISVHIFEKKEL